MKTFTLPMYFAAAYDCGTYGAGQYDDAQQCATAQSTGNSTTDGSGGLLANTGYDVILPLAFAGALIFASLMLLVKRLHRRK